MKSNKLLIRFTLALTFTFCFIGTPLFGQKLLTGSLSLGPGVPSMRIMFDMGNSLYSLVLDREGYPTIVYPVNFTGTITGKNNPISTPSQYTVTLSTSKINTATLISLIGGNSTNRLVYVDTEAGPSGVHLCSTSNLGTGDLIPIDPDVLEIDFKPSFLYSTVNKFDKLGAQVSAVRNGFKNFSIKFGEVEASGVFTYTLTWSNKVKYLKSFNQTHTSDGWFYSKSSANFSGVKNPLE